MKNDFRHYCFITLFSIDEISTVILVDNDLSDNQILRAEQLLKNTKDNLDTILHILEKIPLIGVLKELEKLKRLHLCLVYLKLC